jgi:hypothetical protein
MTLHAQNAAGRVTNREIGAAILRGGLHEAARVAGGYYKMNEPAGPDLIVTDLESIVRASDAVVVGRPKTNLCHLTASGRSITTDYRVVAGDVLYGDIPHGREIIVSVPGGRVQFDDGLVAEVAPIGLVRPAHESRVVMFLNRHRVPSAELTAWANGDPVYQTTLGPMGMFTLGADDSSAITLHGHRRDPVMRANATASTGQFLQAVRSAVNRVRAEGDKRASKR